LNFALYVLAVAFFANAVAVVFLACIINQKRTKELRRKNFGYKLL